MRVFLCMPSRMRSGLQHLFCRANGISTHAEDSALSAHGYDWLLNVDLRPNPRAPLTHKKCYLSPAYERELIDNVCSIEEHRRNITQGLAVYVSCYIMASIFPSNPDPQEISPAALYGEDGLVKLRIATGGAGQTGVLKALAEAFIIFATKSRALPAFRVAWLATDTSLSFNALASSSADIAITYHPYAEHVALQQGVAVRRDFLWRDAFNLIGPVANPAQLPTDGKASIFELFSLLFQRAVKTVDSPAPIRFLSRYDKSANNILESRIWTSLGQTPWSEPYSPWYHIHPSFPFEALKEATRLSEYTLIDRGSWCSHHKSPEFQSMRCYKEGSIEWECSPVNLSKGHILDDDCLGNPAHALLSTHAQDTGLANLFLDWMLWAEGGQSVIRKFKVNGENLHGNSPDMTSTLGSSQRKL